MIIKLTITIKITQKYKKNDAKQDEKLMGVERLNELMLVGFIKNK